MHLRLVSNSKKCFPVTKRILWYIKIGIKRQTKVNWIKWYQTNIKSAFEVENLHSIPRVRKLATHGSHENKKKKRKRMDLDHDAASQVSNEW